tara:strand:- start:254 stop:580 length:327 start_codon:yes stop_codon:yes gene_type:complete
MEFVTITDKANEQVKVLLSELPSDVGLRLAVKGGGCSGLSYDLQFDSGNENDTVIEQGSYKVYMDAKSLIYLKGMSLDFEGGLQGKGFQFINPNATGTCGCGESFSMN